MDSASGFCCTDFSQSTYLLSLDRAFVRLEGSPGHRVFVFSRVTDEDVSDYYSGAAVPAKKLLAAARDLRAILSQGGQRP